MTPSLKTLVGVCLLASASLATPQQDVAPTEGELLFTEQVRPLLESACFECHGPHAERLKGGLMMSSLESLLEGGDEGPAIIAGDPAKSLMIELMRDTDADYRMPPKSALTEEQIVLFERWIELGAPWPGGEKVLKDKRDIDLDAGREWWAYSPPTEPELPAIESAELEALTHNEVDSFVLARLEAAGLQPAPMASDQQLVRRLHFDLLGLPPTPERMRAYMFDRRPNRWELLVEELLGRVEYGERQARAWLDVVRFAQTNGYERDHEKPMAWRYRDYVIESFHRDKPFDLFLREQLAGDEFESPSDEAIIATGFYRIGTWDSEPDDRAQARLDEQDDVLRTIGEGMMGLTIGCARCHDHRTDPIRQQDYYSLLAFVQNITPYKRPKFALDSNLLFALDATPEKLQERERQRVASRAQASGVADVFIQELLARYETPENRPREAAARLKHASKKRFRDKLSDDDKLQLYILQQEASALEGSFEGDLKWALAVSEKGATPEPTSVLKRGRADSPMYEVTPAFPPVLCDTDEASQPTQFPTHETSSGRRTALASWVASPRNPLTARVFVNRLWQGHFGVGLCNTPNDFGVTGGRPSHPELLDWLALRFVESGWSVKQMHRLILNSYTYRMASSSDSEQATEIDPTNRLLWRQNLRRLDAETLRDTSLFVAGKLNSKRGGRGYFPSLSREALAGSSKPGDGWEVTELEERNRRALYAFVKRSQIDPLLEVFDYANPSLPSGARAETTVASQALAMLNSDFLGRCAADLALRVETEAPGDVRAQVELLYNLVLTRAARPHEHEVATDFLASQTRAFSSAADPLIFRARIPDRIEVAYLAQLEPEGFLLGPPRNWSFQRGQWGLRYNQTEQFDRESGPSALLEDLMLRDGRVSASLRFANGSPFASLLLRAHATGEAFIGLQVMLDRDEGMLRLWQHMSPTAEPTELASASMQFEQGRDYALRVELAGETARVWLDDEMRLETNAITHLASGHIGVRTWGAGCELRDLRIGDAELLTPQKRTPEQRALASFALVLLNLNEFLYID